MSKASGEIQSSRARRGRRVRAARVRTEPQADVSQIVTDAQERIAELSRDLEQIMAEDRISESYGPAINAFIETVREVLGNRPLPVEAARRAALAAAASTVWEDTSGPFLSGQQARELLGGVSRQRLDQLAKGDRLMVLEERSGQKRYPAWQFGQDGRPLDALVKAHGLLVSTGKMSPWSAASWCVHEHPELDDRSPREWAATGHDRDTLLLVAGRDAARAAQ